MGQLRSGRPRPQRCVALAALGSAAAVVWHADAPGWRAGFAGSLTPGTVAGSSYGEVPRQRSRCALAAVIRDRETALRTLGLEGERDEPSTDEIKRAFRQQVVRWHPDSPGGDAKRLQEVRDAYELLLKRRPSRTSIDTRIQPDANARVWQEGRLWQDGVPSPGGSGYGGASEGESRQGITNLLPAVLAVAVLGLGFVALGPRDPAPEAPEGTGAVKVVRQRAQPLRGVEYTALAGVAGKRPGSELLLLGNAALPADAGPAARATQIGKGLLAALNEPAAAGASREAKYGSITAVVSDLDFSRIVKVIRNDGDEQIVESRYPYLLFSGRPVARFEKEATQQELLIVAALDIRRPSPDQVDPVFTKIMATEHAPDLLALDLSEAAWLDIAGEFTRATGTEPWQGLRVRGPIGSSEPIAQAS